MHRRHFLSTAAALAAASTRGTAASKATPGLESLIDPNFSGTVLVTSDQQVLLRRGFGLSDRAFAVSCLPEDCYRIASITKLFTSLLILRFAGRSKIDLEAPIKTYLPGYKGPALDRVKIRQLLNHTSGIENYDKGLTSYTSAARDGVVRYQLPHSSQELMDQFASGPLVHEPGTTFDYNNADYVILGKILEAVAGQPYSTILEGEILKPLRLERTGMMQQKAIVPRLTSAYYKDENGPLENEIPVYVENWYAAGGMYSTADDQISFAHALYGGSLLQPDMLAQMLTPGLEEYGFGLWISDLAVNGRKHRFAQRPGRIMGANTLLLRLLDDDITIVILGNTNLVDTDRLGFAIAKQILQKS